MKTKLTITTFAALAAALLTSTAVAETRIWSDTSGKTIEAEQVKLLNDQVVLRLTDGSEIKVSLATLSEADRKQAMLAQPPSLELKVSAKTSRTNSNLRDAGRGSRVQLEEESTRVVAAVSKTSSAPYEMPLDAVLYVIGERGGEQNVVVDKVSSTFTYTGKSREFELQSDAFESVKREGGEKRTEYKGWLLVVTDPNGDVVAMKSNKREYETHAATLLAAEKDTVLNSDYESLNTKKSTKLVRARRF